MFKHKKTAAFILGLMLCASFAAAPANISYADDESSSSASEEESQTADESSDSSDEEEYITSGDYEYSVTSDDTVCIQGYVGSQTEISIPETLDGMSVTEIGENAFLEQPIISVNIPAGITYIADNPFLECTALKEITVDSANENYAAEDGVLYLTRSGNKTLLCYPQGKTETSFDIPDDTKEIGVSAFYSAHITEITLPAGIEYIYRHAFSYNENLVSIDMSQCTDLTTIGDMTFAYCTALTDIQLPDSLTSIGAAAFAGCTSLSTIDLPDALDSIGQNAFAATGFKYIEIPESVTSIGYCALGYDENLEPIDDFIVIGESGSAAETYCTDSDEEYDYENNFTFVTSANKDLISETSGFETKESGDYTYCEKDGEIYILSCSSVSSSIEVPSEFDGVPVTCIYGASFYGSQASEIILPDTVTKIGIAAFGDCDYLKKITLPDSVVEIGEQAFTGCIALESIEIPASCETIGDEAFYGCTAMKKFTVDSSNKNFSAEEGVLYNKDKTVLVAYPTALDEDSFNAPESVTEISMSAFAGNTSLEKVYITTVITIGDYAFEDCTSLTSVKLSENLETIGTCAFYNCTSLLAMRTYNEITEIGDVAIGYYYDEDDTENDGDVLIEDFILYAEEDSGGARYALMNSIECENDVSKYTEPKTPAASFKIFGVKVEKSFVYVVSGIIAVVVIAAVIYLVRRSSKKKKAAEELERLKENAEEKLNAPSGRKEKRK